jgi:hypothetical protein
MMKKYSKMGLPILGRTPKVGKGCSKTTVFSRGQSDNLFFVSDFLTKEK